MTAEAIAQALDGKREGGAWRCLCPVHQGHALIAEDKNGKTLVHCHAGCAQRCRQHYQEGDTRTLECPHSLSPYVPGQPTGVVPFQFDCPAEGAPPPEPSLATWTGLPLTQGTPFRDQSPSAAVGPVLVVIGFNPTQFPSYGTLRNRKRRTHLPR